VAEPFEPAHYVPPAAAALGLRLAPEDLRDVIAAFAVLARVAGPVMAFALSEDLIAAAVFVPDEEARG
jgi:1-carboxybiuret hydrolase subunit AtzG-like protein